MSPPIRERLTSQKPVMTGGKMTLICINDMELQTMKGKYAALISDVYTSFGFPNQLLIFNLTENTNGAEERNMHFLKNGKLKKKKWQEKHLPICKNENKIERKMAIYHLWSIPIRDAN